MKWLVGSRGHLHRGRLGAADRWLFAPRRLAIILFHAL